MPLLYCAVADKTLNSEKNTSPINNIRHLDPRNWHIENGVFSISAKISSLNNAIPQNQNILKALATALIKHAGTYLTHVAGRQAINPLLEFANIFCLDIPDDYYSILISNSHKDILLVDASKVNIVGVFRHSTIDYRFDTKKKGYEVLLNKSAGEKLCAAFQVLAEQAAAIDIKGEPASNNKHPIEYVTFFIDGTPIVPNAENNIVKEGMRNTLWSAPQQRQTPQQPEIPISEEEIRLLKAPSDIQLKRNNRDCQCVLS